MALRITAVRIKPEHTTQEVDWLLANVMDKLRIQVDCEVREIALSSSDNEFIVNNINGYLGVGWVTSLYASPFANFKIGDTVQIGNYATSTVEATLTIIDKISDAEIQLSAAWTGLGNNIPVTNRYIAVANPINGIKYRRNFVENNEQPTYNSKIDGNEQLWVNEQIDPSDPTPFIPIGNKSWQIGNADCSPATVSSTPYYTTTFTITENTFLTPFFLFQQWLANIFVSPKVNADYFFNQKCLKSILKIQAYPDITNPNDFLEDEQTDVLGNTGWFNENFNTGLTNYYVDSIIYKRPDTSLIQAIELVTTETTVEVVIKNTANSPFVLGSTKFTLNFCKAPNSDTEYKNNNRTIKENFTFDRKLCTLGGGAVNGDNYGSNLQVFKNITSTFISASEIKITFNIAMVQTVIDILKESNEPRYLLVVTVSNHTLPTATSDKVALLADAKPFFIDYSDATLATITGGFLRHPESDVDSELQADVDVFPKDELVCYNRFFIDKTGRTNDIINLLRLTAKMKMKNTSTLEEFDLDVFDFNFSGAQIINGNQFVNYSLNRPYHIPPTEPRKSLIVKRRTDLDTGLNYYYEVYFPVLIRWEYWEKLINIQGGANGAMFDINEPFNGSNHDWYRLTTFADWKLHYDFNLVIEKNGHELNFNYEKELTLNNYDSNADYEPDTIKTYDPDTLVQLYDVGTARHFILGDKKTLIVAEFTKISGVPDLNFCQMEIDIEVYESGGVVGRRRYSSKWIADSDTWFTSIDNSSKIVLTVIGNTIKGELKLDGSKLNLSERKYMLSARLYDFENVGGKLFQHGAPFLFQHGAPYNFQHQ